jgi:hypothetical protein
MPVVNVQLGVTAIKELLDNGYTWLKKDDLGFGSVQEKYQAADVQIAAIRKHPLLKDLETTARIFVIVDDTKDNGATTTASSVSESKYGASLASVPESDKRDSGRTSELPESSDNLVGKRMGETSDADSFSAFANL